MCLVCGRENRAGLQARFYILDGGELLGVFVPREEHQGYPGRLHGGIASALLDETIGRAISLSDPDTWGVTVDLSLRYRRPIPLGQEVRALGRITADSSRLFEGSGEILLADGTPAVEATGRYLKMPIERIAGPEFDQSQWFPDPAPAPGEVDV
jgi:acyl-coenzyme A thioesterase PaaI-like protein